VLRLRGKPHGELPWLCEVERSEGGSCKASAQTQPKECSHRPTCRSENLAVAPSAQQMELGEGLNHVVRGGCVAKATTTPPTNPHPNPPPQSVMVAPDQPIVTVTRQTARPQKPEPKSTAVPKQTSGKSNKKAAARVKTAAATPTTPTWWSPPKFPSPHSRKSQSSSITFPNMHVWI